MSVSLAGGIRKQLLCADLAPPAWPVTGGQGSSAGQAGTCQVRLEHLSEGLKSGQVLSLIALFSMRSQRGVIRDS